MVSRCREPAVGHHHARLLGTYTSGLVPRLLSIPRLSCCQKLEIYAHADIIMPIAQSRFSQRSGLEAEPRDYSRKTSGVTASTWRSRNSFTSLETDLIPRPTSCSRLPLTMQNMPLRTPAFHALAHNPCLGIVIGRSLPHS